MNNYARIRPLSLVVFASLIGGSLLLSLVAITQSASAEVTKQGGGATPVTLQVEWRSAHRDHARSVAWGDADGDGDLDLAVGGITEDSIGSGDRFSEGETGTTGTGNVRVYMNTGDELETTASWIADVQGYPTSVAWGDANGDGKLDLAVGNQGMSSLIYLSTTEGSKLSLELCADCLDTIDDPTESLAWGDADGDGTLDLVIGNLRSPSKLYLNRTGNGHLTVCDECFVTDSYPTRSVAWGDVNGDRKLDLAVGNYGAASAIYLNRGDGSGTLEICRDCLPQSDDPTTSLAWGDVDGDDHLDLVLGNYLTPSRIFTNSLGTGRLAVCSTCLDPASDQADPLLVALGQQLIDPVSSVAWGDVDNDGDLDLFVANETALVPDYVRGLNKIYINDNGKLTFCSWCLLLNQNFTTSAAWGDVDGDGDLDLAGGTRLRTEVFLNHGVALSENAVSDDRYAKATHNIAWGDADGDGNLDLYRPPNVAYPDAGDIQGGCDACGIVQDAMGFFNPWGGSRLAWGDVDRDGDLDLAVGGYPGAKLYLNRDGSLNEPPVWRSGSDEDIISAAWSDLDDDGDLDLVVAVNDGPPKLFLGQDDLLQQEAAWSPSDIVEPLAVAWADVDGDGDPDLAVKGIFGTKVYLNDQGHLPQVASQSLAPTDTASQGYSWYDSDSDGAQDLNTNWLSVYFGKRPAHPLYPWRKDEAKSPEGISLTGQLVAVPEDKAVTDGNLDGLLSVPPLLQGIIPITYTLYHPGSEPMGKVKAFYSLNGGGLWQEAAPATRTITTELATLPYPQREITNTHVFYWDVNNSGFFGQSDNVVVRLVAYPGLSPRKNSIPGPFQRPFVSTQTYPFRVRGNQVRVMDTVAPAGNAVVYQLPKGLAQGAMPIGAAGKSFRSAPTGFLPGRGALERGDLLTALYPTDVISTHTPTRLYFSQDSLLPLTITGTQTQDLSLVITDTRRLADIGVLLDISHTLGSDLSATLVAPDGAETALFTTTQSLGNDLIAVTLDQEAFQPVSRQNVTGTVRPATSLEPLVGRPLDGTWTLRLENRGQGASSIVNGWGLALKVSDLFYTSATPTDRDLEMTEVRAGGVQTLTVSPANPLMVFDLDIALEWDARNDSKYLAQLEFDLKRASEFLYDWTNGQAALGRITVYHDAKRSVFPGQGDPWSEVDIRIYATNRMRPSAAQGGIVSEPFTDPEKGEDASEVNVYGPGQVTMGAVWNRFGDASGNLGEDWPRTLAHELGHYLLFLDDNYLGMDDGLLVTVDGCPGAMADHYLDDHDKGYGEFNTEDLAAAACQQTLSRQRTGRSDWQTIETFYPALHGPTLGATSEGPISLPLDLTQVQFVSPISMTQTLVAPVIDLKFDGRAATQTTNARVFLFKDGDEWIVDLGRPKLDQVAAHGAEPGDRLCTFDLILGRAGCIDDLKDTTTVRSLVKEPETWKPRISILPAGRNALEVRVEGVDSNDLHVRLFPQDFPAGPAKDLRRVAEKAYTATFTMTVPAYTGYVHVWEGPESGREHEIVTDYALGGRPAFVQDLAGGMPALSPDLAKMRANSLAKMRGSSIAKMRASSLAKMRASSIAKMRASSLGKIRAYAAAMSSDGQVLLAGDELKFDDGEYVTLQAATAPESIPSWATLVGQVYQISVSTPTIPITNASLSFGYLGGDVPAGQEEGLRIHFWNGVIWEELPTRLDTGNNYASAKLKGPGRYALLTSVEIPLQPGWNLVGYPVQTSGVDVALRRIDEVLRDIAGQYSVVYGYDACAPGGGWQVYSPGAPGWVSDLVAPDFGRGYWINVTAGEPITLHLRGEFSSGEVEATKPTATTACVERPSSAAIPAPPTTFYGNVLPDAGFSPAAGQEVVARVDGVPCGEGVTRQEGADVVYEVAVEAASSKRACGSADKLVTFRIGDRLIGSHPWTGNGLELLDLQVGHRAAGVEVQAPACTKLLPNGDFELGLSWDASPVGDVTLTAGQGRRNTQGLRLSTAPGNTVSIERELTLPGDARRLKLAFAFKRADGVEFAPDLTLFANGQPKWQQKSANSVWREASIDLTPYRGQRVRLKLEARGWQPRQSSAVILDDLDVLVCR